LPLVKGLRVAVGFKEAVRICNLVSIRSNPRQALPATPLTRGNSMFHVWVNVGFMVCPPWRDGPAATLRLVWIVCSTMDVSGSCTPVVPCCVVGDCGLVLIVIIGFMVCPPWRDGPAATLRLVWIVCSTMNVPSSGTPVVPCCVIGELGFGFNGQCWFHGLSTMAGRARRYIKVGLDCVFNYGRIW
jgi:hypothetical protein